MVTIDLRNPITCYTIINDPKMNTIHTIFYKTVNTCVIMLILYVYCTKTVTTTGINVQLFNLPVGRLCRQRCKCVLEGGDGGVTPQTVRENLALSHAVVRDTQQDVVVHGVLAERSDASQRREIGRVRAL